MVAIIKYILMYLFHITVLQLCKPLSTNATGKVKHKKTDQGKHIQLGTKSFTKMKIMKGIPVRGFSFILAPEMSRDKFFFADKQTLSVDEETRRSTRITKQPRGKDSKRNQIRNMKSKTSRSKPVTDWNSSKSLTDNRRETEIGCCQNGGQCVLGSFCICPSKFFGRYCEFELKMEDCGAVRHLGWARDRCNLCYCYNGTLSCLPRGRSTCENSTNVELIQNSVELEIFQPKSNIGENIPHLTSSAHDYDEEDYENDSADLADPMSHSNSPTPTWMTCIIIGVVYSIQPIMANLPS